MSTLNGKRVVVTCADIYMGPAVSERFRELGAEVLTSESSLLDQVNVDSLLEEAGEVDILIANLAGTPHIASVDEIEDDDWFTLCDRLLHPLMRLLRAFLPQMKARRAGKIVAITSAAGLRTVPEMASYSTMRAAQNSLIRTAAVEAAPFNVQINAIAQNYVASETYFPEELINNPEFIKQVSSVLPTQRIAAGSATADLAAFLASDANTHIVGHAVPFAGGWDVMSDFGWDPRALE
jgi:2-keto-3-deoxy-L-fuconate dehydrogenase